MLINSLIIFAVALIVLGAMLSFSLFYLSLYNAAQVKVKKD